jgi:amidase
VKLTEYAAHDALGLAALVAKKQVTPTELAQTAAKAIEAVNGEVNAVVETYPDRIDSLDEKSLGHGPFRGVPFLMKDVFGHEKGRLCENASRLAKGYVVELDSYLCQQFKASGVNIIGRSAAPEFSMSGTTETILYGNTSTPWKKGYSAGGSSGGAAAAVSSGMVPMAHGSDIGGSIRIPASLCGGVGLKPSRGRVPVSPLIDEGGLGFSTNHVQTLSVRDAAAMLDYVSKPQVGDPFIIPKPSEPYTTLYRKSPGKLRIALVLNDILGVKVDKEVAATVTATAKQLEAMGHTVTEVKADMGGLATMLPLNSIFFFAFYARLDALAAKMRRKVGPDTLEPAMLKVYEWSKTITPADFMTALASVNVARRKLAQVYVEHDLWLSPTTARTSESWGRYHLARTDVDPRTNFLEEMFAVPCQFTIPHNIMGTPAISLPLAITSAGLPVGVQIAGRPAEEHVVLQVAAQLEEAMPWRDRRPPLHVDHAAGSGGTMTAAKGVKPAAAKKRPKST